MGAPEQPKVTPEANREAQIMADKGKLDALKKDIITGQQAAAEEKEALKGSLPKLDLAEQTFDTTSVAAFGNSVKAAIDGLITEADATKKEKLVNLGLEKVMESFQTALTTPDYYAVLAEGVPKVELKVMIADGVVTLDYKTPNDKLEYEKAKKIVEERVAALPDGGPSNGKTEEEFKKEYPMLSGLLPNLVDGANDTEKAANIKKLFNGDGNPLLVAVLGLMGFGKGVDIVSSIGKSIFGDKFDGFKKGLTELSKGALEMRTQIALEKDSDFAQYYAGIRDGVTKDVAERFLTKGKITLPKTTFFKEIVLPKSDTGEWELSIKGGTKKFPADKSIEKITLAAGAELPPGTQFKDIVVGDASATPAAAETPAA